MDFISSGSGKKKPDTFVPLEERLRESWWENANLSQIWYIGGEDF